MRIALLTNTWYPKGEPEYIVYTDRLKSLWCRRHGWDFLRTRNRRCAPNRPEWEKLPCVDDALSAGYDWAIWMDADAAPVCMDVDIEGYLSALSDVFIAISDINGINTGVFGVDRGSRVGRMLNVTRALMGESRYNTSFFEQTAFSDVLQLPPFRGLQLEPPTDLGWQCYQERYRALVGSSGSVYQEGRWVLHCPATPDAVRLDVFRSIVRKHANMTDG